MIKIGRPNTAEAPSWYPYFFNLAPGDDLITTLKISKLQTLELINSIPPAAENHKYAEDKWTIKQVFIHLCDEERYYAYKSFCYTRQTDVNLEIPMGKGYTHDFNAANRTLQDIRDEYLSVRDASISLFSTMTNEMLDFNFPNQTIPYTARSLGWMIAGHNIHHCNLVCEKYLA